MKIRFSNHAAKRSKQRVGKGPTGEVINRLEELCRSVPDGLQFTIWKDGFGYVCKREAWTTIVLTVLAPGMRTKARA